MSAVKQKLNVKGLNVKGMSMFLAHTVANTLWSDDNIRITLKL